MMTFVSHGYGCRPGSCRRWTYGACYPKRSQSNSIPRGRHMSELHRNLIGGEWGGGDAVPNINPSDTNDVVGDYARATKADAEAAIAAARAAFPSWSRSGPLARHAVLRKASDEITARKDELGRLLSR